MDTRKIIRNIKGFIIELKNQLVILHLAYSDSKSPLLAKLIIIITLAYALSPIDLIPDFIPILGLLDDLVLLPLGIYISIKALPQQVIVDARKKAHNYEWNKPTNWWMGTIIILIWLIITISLYFQLF